MIDATNGVGPLGNQQFSTKGIKLSDLKEKNQLLFDYFKQAGLNENSYVYSTDIEKLKEAYDKNDNGKLSKKEARAIFGDDVSRKDIKKALKAMDTILTTDLDEGKYKFPVQVSENEIEYYSKNNVLHESVYEDDQQRIHNYYGPNKEILAQNVHTKNSDGTYNPERTTLNEYNEDGTLYSCSEKTYGDDGAFEEVKMIFLNGDQNKPLKIEHNVNGNKKTTDIEYNNDGKRIRSIISEAGQKTEIAYDQQERPMKQFVKPNGSDTMTIYEYKYDGLSSEPSEILTTNPDGTQTKVTYKDGKFVSREEIVKLNPDDVIEKRKESNPPKAKVTPKVHVPDDWGRVPTSFRHSSGIMEAKDADAALKALLDARNIKAADVDVDKLKADLIKYNPSLFDKDGKVKDNAKWDRLDLPKDLKAQYGIQPQITPAPDEDVPEYLRPPKDEEFEMPKFELPKHDWWSKKPEEGDKKPEATPELPSDKDKIKPQTPPQITPAPDEDVPEYLRPPKDEEFEMPKFELPKHDWWSKKTEEGDTKPEVKPELPSDKDKIKPQTPPKITPAPDDEVPEYLRPPKDEEFEVPKFELPKHDWD